MAKYQIGGTDEMLRPSEVFARRLRALRVSRRWTQSELAQRMEEQGRPISKTALLRIEKGERALTLDEACALTLVLRGVPAQLLSPPEGEMLGLTGQQGVDGTGLRNWLRFGEPFPMATEAGRRAVRSSELERDVLVHAQALIDAKNGNDNAGIREALTALGLAAIAHREALEADDG
jgi:transcriptional regulator with XRE-family HTH domain